MSEEFLMF